MSTQRLYVIVLKSMSSGLKIPQALHSFHAFHREHPGIVAEWERDENLVILQHPDLAQTVAELRARGLTFSLFHEPDQGNALTAICAEPAAKHALRKYELAS